MDSRLSGKGMCLHVNTGSQARWPGPHPTGRRFKPGPLLCRNSPADLGVANGWPWCRLPPFLLLVSLGAWGCSLCSRFRPGEAHGSLGGSWLPNCSRDTLTVSFPTVLCSARSLPGEARASWGMFMEQDGEEGRGGFCSCRFQALAAFWSDLDLRGSQAVTPSSPWAGSVC